MNVKNIFLLGVLWSSIEKVLVKGSAFIIGIVLARILSPGDYGLVGMLTIFTALSNVIIEGGFSKALIQKQDCSNLDYSTAFIINLCLSVFIYIVLFVCAPFISYFYNEPILKDLLRVFSLNLVLGAFNVVQRAQLQRRMDFKSLAKINFISVVVGGGVAIIAAYYGAGVWALVAQTIVGTGIMLFLFPLYSKWKPSLLFSRSSFRQLFSFGSKLLISGTISTIEKNIVTLAIGKAYNSVQLGYYTRATQFSELVAYCVHDIIGTVSFPALSRLQDDSHNLISVYRKTLYYTAMFIIPLMVLMALLAEPLVMLLLTEKWLPCVPFLQILCFARMFTPMSAINMNILNAIGRSDLFLKVDLFKTPIVVLGIIITIPLGIKAVVYGNLITTIISFFINAYYPGRLYGYGAREQIKDWIPIVTSALFMAIVVFIIINTIANIWLQIIIGSFVGIVVYILICIMLNVIAVDILKKYKKHE